MWNQLAADTAGQAQAILGAWKSGDIELFHEELDRVGECAMDAVEPEEMERLELLRAIAADLRFQPLADDPGNVYGNLLHHLAFSRKPSRAPYGKQAIVIQ